MAHKLLFVRDCFQTGKFPWKKLGKTGEKRPQLLDKKVFSAYENRMSYLLHLIEAVSLIMIKASPEYCVLIADDDVDDQYMLKQAFANSNMDNEIRMVNDGVELLDYLNKRGKYKDVELPYPRVILLDLNMPKKDGRECLKEIKSNRKLSKIPIVIYSTSNNPDDISKSYELGASSYITKPYSYKELVDIVEIFRKYWFVAVKTTQVNL